MDEVTPATPKLAYTMRELASACGVSRSQLYKEAQAKRLKLTKLGTRTIILVGDAQAWLQLVQAEQKQ